MGCLNEDCLPDFSSGVGQCYDNLVCDPDTLTCQNPPPAPPDPVDPVDPVDPENPEGNSSSFPTWAYIAIAAGGIIVLAVIILVILKVIKGKKNQSGAKKMAEETPVFDEEEPKEFAINSGDRKSKEAHYVPPNYV